LSKSNVFKLESDASIEKYHTDVFLPFWSDSFVFFLSQNMDGVFLVSGNIITKFLSRKLENKLLIQTPDIYTHNLWQKARVSSQALSPAHAGAAVGCIIADTFSVRPFSSPARPLVVATH